MKDNRAAYHSREYLTGLFGRRSVIALCSCLMMLLVSFYGVISGVIRTIEMLGLNGFASFRYYTMLVNTFAALTAAIALPYAVEGIRAKRFALPRWVVKMHYICACAVTIMMSFVFAFMSWSTPEGAFAGSNLFTHVVCPALILLSFFQVENGYVYTAGDLIYGFISFGIYVVVYAVQVFLIGEANGGWPDIYLIGEYLPPALSLFLMLILGMGISALIAVLSNRLTRRRKEKMLRCWTEDLDPVEVKVEAYGLGRMAGLHAVKGSVQLPFDILDALAERYRLDPDSLTRPYVTGFLNGLRERK